MPSNIDQFLQNLVLPDEPKYYATNYMDTPYALRSQRIILAEKVLNSVRLRKYQLLTTPTLSSCGLYVHLPTCLIVVYCEDNGSFVIRKNLFELLDVIMRTQINKEIGPSFDDSEFVELSHLANKDEITDTSASDDEENGAITVECLLRELKILEEDNNITIPLELKFAKTISPNPSHIFANLSNIILHYTRPLPLLPIYIGILDPKREVIEPLNYNEEHYRKYMILNKKSLVFFQKFYTSLRIRDVIVSPLGNSNEELPKLEVLIDHLLEVEKTLRLNNQHDEADRDDIVTKVMYFYQQIYPSTISRSESPITISPEPKISTPKDLKVQEVLQPHSSVSSGDKASTPKDSEVIEIVQPQSAPPLRNNISTPLVRFQNEVQAPSTTPVAKNGKEVHLQSTTPTRNQILPKHLNKIKLFGGTTTSGKNQTIPDLSKKATPVSRSTVNIPKAFRSIKLIHNSVDYDDDSPSSLSSPSLPPSPSPSPQPVKLQSTNGNGNGNALQSVTPSNGNVTPEKQLNITSASKKPDFISPLPSSESDTSPLITAAQTFKPNVAISELESKKRLATKALGVPNTALGINRKLRNQHPNRQAFSELNTPSRAPRAAGDPRSIINRMEIKNFINELDNEMSTKKSVLEVEQSRIFSSSSQSQSQSQSQSLLRANESEVINSTSSTDLDKQSLSQEQDTGILKADEQKHETTRLSQLGSVLDTDVEDSNSIEHSQVVIPGEMESQASEYIVKRYMEETSDGPKTANKTENEHISKRRRKNAPARRRKLRSATVEE